MDCCVMINIHLQVIFLTYWLGVKWPAQLLWSCLCVSQTLEIKIWKKKELFSYGNGGKEKFCKCFLRSSSLSDLYSDPSFGFDFSLVFFFMLFFDRATFYCIPSLACDPLLNPFVQIQLYCHLLNLQTYKNAS